MKPPAIIKLPLSTVENMTCELAWMFDDVMEQVKTIQKDLEDLERTFKDYPTPRSTANKHGRKYVLPC
jgi:hypothetical protein